MTKRRSYRQYCGLAKALDVVGERWTLLIVRDLLLGARRYTDLLQALPGITTNLLAKRLGELEAAGLAARREQHGAQLWELTATGAALEPVVIELGRWGGRYLDRPRRGERLDIGWALLSLKRRYRGGLDGVTVELAVDERGRWRRFTLAGQGARLLVRERGAEQPHATVSGAAAAMRAWLIEGRAGEPLVRAGDLIVEGDREAWRALGDALAPPPRPFSA
jgi:DNA-binding HxlR family transcriptional regulator